MISFELAKELREVGFPQEQGDGCHYWYKAANGKGAYHGPWFAAHRDREIGFIPDLEALIEVLGEDFLKLKRMMKGWSATGGCLDTRRGPLNEQSVYGADSPAEAVARLFLALKEAK